MPRKILLAVFTSLFIHSLPYCQEKTSADKRQDSINLLLNRMQEDGSVTSIAISYGGISSPQYYRFLFLLTMLNNKELVDLTKHTVGCIRLYAYMGLVHNEYPEVKTIQASMSCDTTRIATMSGCIIGLTTINDAIFRIDHWYWKDQTMKILDLIKNDQEFRKQQFPYLFMDN